MYPWILHFLNLGQRDPRVYRMRSIVHRLRRIDAQVVEGLHKFIDLAFDEPEKAAFLLQRTA